MKDYAYARTLLGLVGFVVWLGFIAGVLMAYWAASRTGSPIAIAFSVMSVIGLLLSTIVILALVQVGKAILDIAENTAVRPGTMPSPAPQVRAEPSGSPPLRASR